MWEDFFPNFGYERTGCFFTTAHRLTLSFSQRIFFTKKQHDCSPPPTILLPISRLEMKLKVHHFDTIKVIDADSWAVLNTLTDQNFQGCI
jgi:hypothetical protein